MSEKNALFFHNLTPLWSNDKSVAEAKQQN